MISLRGSWERRSKLTGLQSRARVALLGAFACTACSEGGAEPPAENAGTSSMSGSGGNATGNTGGSGNSAGGTAGGGGSGMGGSTGGGNVAASTFYNFDDSVEGFRINYICTATGVCTPVNPATPAGDAGAGDAGAPPQEPDNGLATVSHDPDVGNPQPGSVQVDINFTAAGQQAVLALNFGATDFTGRTMSALVTVESGAPAQLVGKMYIKTGEMYVYADSGEKLLPPGMWTPFSFDPVNPSYTANAMYNPVDVREIGFEFSIPMATAGFTPAEIHVDTVQF